MKADGQAQTYTYKYPKADNTADAVVFTICPEGVLRVLLIQRGDEPFKGYLALPGGYANMEEALSESAARELREETGLVIPYVEQLGTYSEPDRDPRGRVITTAYLALVPFQKVVGMDDAVDAMWCPVTSAQALTLAFDHDDILTDALQRLRSKLPWQPVGRHLLPKEFTLAELQHVYEVILGKQLDRRNFRSKVLSLRATRPCSPGRSSERAVLQPSPNTRPTSGRPARLFTFDVAAYEALVAEGTDFEI